MVRRSGQGEQAAFASVLAALLRTSRRRQGLTQAQVATRTSGVVSKAALANYETGHRSLRVDVFWVIARALGEDPGALLIAAERRSGYGADTKAPPVSVDVEALQNSTDPRLAPVRRWFAVRLRRDGTRFAVHTVTLDHGALVALADLMGVSPDECRRLLAAVRREDAGDPDGAPAGSSGTGGPSVRVGPDLGPHAAGPAVAAVG
jgi:transcriptional regulator with XRE-family HTH domain